MSRLWSLLASFKNQDAITLQVDGGDAHIIINEAGGGVSGVEGGVGIGPVRVGGGWRRHRRSWR
jgi:hypothetical protein